MKEKVKTILLLDAYAGILFIAGMIVQSKFNIIQLSFDLIK